MAETATAPFLITVGGFLGSGKTTALIRIAHAFAARGNTVGIITNDQAEGLVDSERFRSNGFSVGEVAGGCFCCRFDDFIQRADEIVERNSPDVLLAEPVGSCTDLVATVLRPLQERHPDRFRIAPFVTLVDPIRVLNVLGNEGPVRLSEKVSYIFRLQQHEADAIALNKVDLVTADQLERARALLAEKMRSGADNLEIFPVSAKTGSGFEALMEWLTSRTPGGRSLQSIDYDSYAAGEAELGWLDQTISLRASAPLGVDQALLSLITGLASRLRRSGIEIAHGKILLRGSERSALASFTRSDETPQLVQEANESSDHLELVANLRAQCEPEDLENAFAEALSDWSQETRAVASASHGNAFKPPRPVPTHRLA